MIHRHTALAIRVLLFLLIVALLSAGCTSASVNKEPSVPPPEKTTAMQTTENLPTPVNSLEIPKNPEANESMIIAPPENNTCGSPDANQSVCPVPTFTGTQVLLSVTQTTDQATAYCMAMNNSLEIRKDPDGSEYTFCILADGTSCDVWDYYRGVCPLITTQETGTGYTGVAWAGPDIQDLASGFCTAMNNRLEPGRTLTEPYRWSASWPMALNAT